METPIPLRRERLKGLHRQHTFIRWFISTALAMAVLYVLLFICFVAVDMGNNSMAPTLQQGDMVLVDRLGKHMRHVQRTDLVAFTGPEGQLLIRRVVALEGESISCRGGRLYIDGNYRLEEKSYTDSLCQDFGPVTVPEGYIFVLCDDRQYGLDSRTLGCIRFSDIMGYVNIRFLREFAIIE